MNIYIYILNTLSTQYPLFLNFPSLLDLYNIYSLKCSRFYPKTFKLQTLFYHNESGSFFYRKKTEYHKFTRKRTTKPKQSELL